MSYLTLPNGIPDFSKIVISFWFFCSSETMKKAHDEGTSIDLLVFGDRPTVTGFHAAQGPDKTYDIAWFEVDEGPFPQGYHATGETGSGWLGNDTILGTGSDSQTPPSMIYLSTTDTSLILNVTLQLSHSGESAGAGFTTTIDATNTMNVVSSPFGIPEFTDDYLGTSGYAPPPFHVDQVGTEITLPEQGDKFNIGGSMAGVEGSRSCEVTPDAWHHVLFSVDLSGEMSSSGTLSTMTLIPGDHPYNWAVDTEASIMTGCKVWLAIDDENVSGQDLVTAILPEMGLGPNDLVSQSTAGTWHQGNNNDYTTHNIFRHIEEFNSGFGVWEQSYKGYGVLPTYSLSEIEIKAKGFPLGIPSTEDWGINEHPPSILKVSMAELQIFTGVTLDTTVEANRRLFITAKGKDGKQRPLNPTPITIPINRLADISDPATWEPGADWPAYVPPLLDPSVIPSTVKFDGGTATTADVDFTKSSVNWQAGVNLGTASKGEKVEKTGKIKAYSPDPSIGG